MSEPRWGYYLTTGPASDGGLLAVISDGSPQFGHEPVTMLSIERVRDVAEARTWFKKMKRERPWETRQ